MSQGLRVLILDDDIMRHAAFAQRLSGNEIHHASSAKIAITSLENNVPYDIIFLDHDLGAAEGPGLPDPGTGYEVAKWLAEHPDKQPKMIILHTLNPIGAKNMKACLPDAQWLPGIWSWEG